MDIDEAEEILFSIGEPKLHGEMCKTLCSIYCKVLELFPAFEAARLRSTSGIQALCTLHIALEKTKNILQHCSDCSKLYLAITGDSVVLKFEKALCVLEDSLRLVKDVVPKDIGHQISEILRELENIEFTLDPIEKQVGDDVAALLQQGRKFSSANNKEATELDCFQKSATTLGITSSRAALRERRALKKLIERARAEEDKRKESIVAYLLHLMRKHSKLFRREDSNSLSSLLASPTSQSSFGSCGGGNDNKPFLKLSSFNFKPNFRRAGPAPVTPEELRCPISLQLMYDPVIIASGQTYERICIEKWFSDGHNTCPKTQHQLSYLGLTPNYSVKGMISSWCEHNGVPLPDGPPESLDLNYWRLSLSVSDSENLKSMDTISSSKFKDLKVVSCKENDAIEVVEEPIVVSSEDKVDVLAKHKELLQELGEEKGLSGKCKIVKKVRHLVKNDEKARVYMGENGFVDALVKFLQSAVQEKNEAAQEMGAMALFNLAVNNNKNKEMMLGAGVLGVLEEMVSNAKAQGPASALYLNLSCYEEAKLLIGSSKAVGFLVEVLKNETDLQCKLDALHTLYNLSWHPSNITPLLSAGIISGLQSLITDPDDHTWTEKCIAIYMNIALTNSARDEMIAAPGVISSLSTILDVGEPVEQEQAATCLLLLCNENEKCSEMLLQEGVIPSLVSLSVNGTVRGKQKAQKLLLMFREHAERTTEHERQSTRESEPEPERCQSREICLLPSPDQKQNSLSKAVSKRVMGKAWGYLWKYKSFSSGLVPGLWIKGCNANSTKKSRLLSKYVCIA